MSQKTITFSISKEGNATVKDVCGAGVDCQATTADIEDLLGVADDKSRQFTDNYNHQVVDDLKLNRQ